MQSIEEHNCQVSYKQWTNRFACKQFGKEEDLEIYKNKQAQNEPQT